MNSVHLGERVKELIEKSGETKAEAAKRLKMSRNALYETFRSKDIGTEKLKKIAAAYRVDIGYFFAGDVVQRGTINSVGGAEISYEGNSETGLLKFIKMENDGLKAENRALREQVETLKEMIQLLKERTK